MQVATGAHKIDRRAGTTIGEADPVARGVGILKPRLDIMSSII